MTPIRFVGLDGEMTGSGSRNTEPAALEYQLIQIGLATMKMEPLTKHHEKGVFVPDTLSTFVSDIGYDRWNSEPRAMEVNRFTRERIKTGPRPALVDLQATEWLDARLGEGRRDLHAVGWNVGSFDMPFVREYLPALGDRFSYRSVDLNSILFSVADTDDEYRELKAKAKGRAESALRALGTKPAWHNAGYDAAAALMAFKYLREDILCEEFA